jgi:hypothetical protein
VDTKEGARYTPQEEEPIKWAEQRLTREAFPLLLLLPFPGQGAKKMERSVSLSFL